MLTKTREDDKDLEVKKAKNPNLSTSAPRDMLSNQVAVNNQTAAKNFGGQQSGGDLDRQASEKDASPEKDAPGPGPEALAEPDVEDS